MNIDIRPGESYKVELVTFDDGHSALRVTTDGKPSWVTDEGIVSVVSLAEGVAPSVG